MAHVEYCMVHIPAAMLQGRMLYAVCAGARPPSTMFLKLLARGQIKASKKAGQTVQAQARKLPPADAVRKGYSRTLSAPAVRQTDRAGAGLRNRGPVRRNAARRALYS